MIADLLLAVLVVLLLGSLPVWPWSRRWGSHGAGGVSVVLLVVVLLLLLNVI